MRLHNFCINRTVEEEKMLVSADGTKSEILPGRWSKTPLFDDRGRPVEYLLDPTAPPTTAEERVAAASGSRHTTRNRLVEAIRQEGLVRPAVRAGPSRAR